MRGLFLIYLFVLLATPVMACLKHLQYQEKDTYEDGFPVLYRALDMAHAYDYVKSFNFKDEQHLRAQINLILLKNKLNTVLDLAFHLSCLGRDYEALALTKCLKIQYPNDYQVNASLGSYYEAIDKLDSAYYYIKEAEKLSTQARHNHAWVHLAVIKAKMAVKNDPEWLLKNQILNIEITENQHLNPILLKNTLAQIYHYLENTIAFTTAPNPIQAKLLLELGIILENNISFQQAYIAYKIAEYYQHPVSLNLKNRLNNLEEIFDIQENENAGFERPKLEDYFKNQVDVQKMYHCDKRRRRQEIIRCESSKPIHKLQGREAGFTEIKEKFEKQSKRQLFRVFTILLGLMMFCIQYVERCKNAQ